MTYKEKLKELYGKDPGLIEDAENKTCPGFYFIGAPIMRASCASLNCKLCWKRNYKSERFEKINRKKDIKTKEEHNQTAKADAGKPRISLVPMQIIWDIAEIREYGTRKYMDPDNWKRVELDRYVDALLRHTLAFVENHDSVDEESGLHHYKHMACNMAFICEMMGEK